MRPNVLWIVLIAAVLLVGCSNDEAPPEPPVQVIKLLETDQQDFFPSRRFIGRVEAKSTVNLAFRVGGRIETFPAVQGTTIPRGELIAQLDPTDYALQVRSAEAEVEQARKHLNRQRNLYSHNAVSETVLDAARADAELAETQLENAKQQLAYTTLNAPFDALVTRRLVENHTTVPPNAEVVRIQDISELRVRINVPEALMQHLESGSAFNIEAEIATLPGERIPLVYREHVTEPDVVAQTYQVEFAPADGVSPIALPGTTATVIIELEEALTTSVVAVPSSALDHTEEGVFRVWVYDPETGTVSPQQVVVGEVTNDLVIIVAGLAPGVPIAATGVQLLRDGMRVKPLEAAL
ncbi:efflux RND transporter periplasmic adaptor subunit [Halomonas sp. GFAJ-1]|uniref:efflux RND transporter periplasmic adaptor subunit n=1 Tax=Halomonas sp. GFAJ-1 TaxID=1118153 RepID=UPI00023A2EFD|nr:efflux RND transporter periplasmic adaptor subunit [Halomonas sp. GFAJ-1]AVI63782.1 efflux transporter periplasmic adaptor subunit [Halomonas sp. GFAJ-1]EHK60547.1 Efflux transporter, RND family, MFP subunit [Halomonas sp. GFAJ-1]